VDNDPAAIGTLIEELGILGQELTVGMDVVGGIANLVQAMLAGPAESSVLLLFARGPTKEAHRRDLN
jgi:hypothetical protein